MYIPLTLRHGNGGCLRPWVMPAIDASGDKAHDNHGYCDGDRCDSILASNPPLYIAYDSQHILL